MPAPEIKPTQSKDYNCWMLSILVRFSSGIEVPAGKPVTCSPGQGMYLHISQAALDEIKNVDETTAEKSNKRVVIRAQVGDEKEIVLGTLSYGRCDQMPLDLVFGSDFKISHNSPDCSIYVCGYRTQAPDGEYPCMLS
ncbi:unnamed protein product [Sphagnum tenellum]